MSKMTDAEAKKMAEVKKKLADGMTSALSGEITPEELNAISLAADREIKTIEKRLRIKTAG